MGLDVRLRLARLYLCTDARTGQGDLADFLSAAFAGGVDIVRIVEPGLNPQAELEALEVARQAAAPHHGIVCVDSSPELARQFSADMLHLGQDDGKPAKARRSLHQWAILGRSTHSARQIRDALSDPDLDYLTVGPVFTTSVSPTVPPSGLELVRQAAQAAPIFTLESKPWFAEGRITLDTLDDVIAAGARRICVTRAITRAADPADAAGRLRSRLVQAWQADPDSKAYTFRASAGAGLAR